MAPALCANCGGPGSLPGRVFPLCENAPGGGAGCESRRKALRPRLQQGLQGLSAAMARPPPSGFLIARAALRLPTVSRRKDGLLRGRPRPARACRHRRIAPYSFRARPWGYPRGSARAWWRRCPLRGPGCAFSFRVTRQNWYWLLFWFCCFCCCLFFWFCCCFCC